jgi:hypothetical protein
MTTTIEDITPAMAEKYLSSNTHNRPVRDNTVARYARDMKNGHWRLTHQGIAFAEDGTLIDGQHRLWAIFNSGVTVRMMVTRGATMESQEHVDAVERRTVGDVLSLRGQPVRTVHVGVAKILASQQGINSPTRHEIMDAYEKHMDAILLSADVFPKMPHYIFVGPVLTVIARASYTRKREELERFATVLATGEMIDKRDKPTILLRNWLLERNPKRSEIYGKAQRALFAFLEGQQVATLYAAPTELFPLPGDKTKAKEARSRHLRQLKTKLAREQKRRDMGGKAERAVRQ